MSEFVVRAEMREDSGKGASRRLRREGKVPVILYGADRPPRALALNHNEVLRFIEDESFFSSVIEFKAEGGKKSQTVVLKDMQRHPSKPVIMHMDFMRVTAGQEIVMNIPLHFDGADSSPAGKTSGVVIDYQLNEVEVSCLPKDLPEFISVDVSEFDVGDNLHLTDLKLPKGVALTAFTHGDTEEHDAVVVSTSRVGGEEEAETDEAPAADEVEASQQKTEEE
ncbi:50S ribosomal protein L25/general stress protein Ctc [Marinicella sp. W31]|uniref:50S ribosomal protein L25/general stress protein Ctc n=1 Tax=Marinicella sp. W31 TaxID=3023713 RepID=UPI003756B52C